MIERGCRHRLLGPIVILLLVLLLASVFLHVAIEGAEAAAELGNLCVAVAAALGSLLVLRSRPSIVPRTVETAERGPPRVAVVGAIGSAGRFATPIATPLRR
jgi:hypothetical protein